MNNDHSLNEIFGLKSILKSYSIRNFKKDSIVPILFSASAVFLSFFLCEDTFQLVSAAGSIGVTIMPSYLGLLVASYAVLLTLLSGSIGEKLQQRGQEISSEMNRNENDLNKGIYLIRNMNSDFAACILIAIVTLFVSFVVLTFCKMEISLSCGANVINLIGFFLISFLLTFSLTVLFGLIVGLFNLAQTITLK